MQIGAAAAGGTVTANPTGREIGFARRIAITEAGAGHPLLTGRPVSFDAPAIHLDAITGLPGDITVLAANALTGVQAAEIRHDGGTFWGVQYHPEFSLREVAVILERMTGPLMAEGFRRSIDDAKAYVGDLLALHDDPTRQDLAWAHGLDRQVLDPHLRLTEIRNFLDYRVKPVASERGRG